MIENLFTFVRTLGNQRIQGKKFFVTQVGLLGTVSDNSGSVGTSGKVLSSTGSGVSWITVGSGNSNVAVLNDLTDVVISTAVEGNLLRYNGTSWVNWAPNFLTAYGSLNDLSDVNVPNPDNGQILRYDDTTNVWYADDESVLGIPNLQDVTDEGSTTTNSITAANLNTAGTVTAAVVTTPLIERGSVLRINSEEQIDQGDPNPDLLYVSWDGTNKFVINADGYAIATTGYKVVGGTASGFLKANGTIDTSTYLTSYTETQTLDAVTDLGNTTTNTITVGGVITPVVYSPTLWATDGAIRIMSDELGNLQPDQGDPANPVIYFDWMENTLGFVDTDGKVTFNGYKTPAGTASGFLKANGTVDTSAYITGIDYLDYIGDVEIISAAVGDVLMFNGTEWVNDSISSIDYISKVQHEVKAGVAIAKGQAVYVTSANGENMIVGLASNTTEATSSKTMGLALSSAAINGKFFVVTEGLVDGLDTSTATVGDAVWLGVNGALIFKLTNKPVAPAHLVYLGVVTRAQANNGEIFVHVQNGFELNEIHDALIVSPIAGQLLQRASDGLWKNWTPDFITASSVDVLTNKRINLSTTIASIVSVDSTDPLLGQIDIVVYQDGIDKGGRINVDSEGLVSIKNEGIGYYTGQVQTEDGTRFLITVSGNTLTGTLAEFNEALTDGDFATQAYVGTQISNLVDSAPATLDTLNELAAALGDDPNFATTVATSIGTKQNQLNGTGFVKASGTTISYDNSTYLTSESDPVFTSSPAYEITTENLGEWSDAYAWGDHSTAGYLTSLPAHSHIIGDVTGLQDELNLKSPIASPTFTGTPAAPTAATSTNTTQIATTAFVKAQGYITSETDPFFTESAAYNITAENILSWDDAYGWGNHADYGYLTSIPAHNHDDRYYTESESDSRFYLATNPSGYISSYVDTVTSVGIIDDLSTGDIVLKGGGATTITKVGGTITITSTDTDTNTTYSAGTGLTLSGTTFSVTANTFAAASHTHAASDITSGTLSTDRLPKQELGISIVGNFGQWQGHAAYTNFNTDVAYWGWNFVQGATNAPHQISEQWYRGRFSLGSEYGFGSSSGDYWMEIAIPRYNQSSTSGNLFVRTANNGVINGWEGVRAAYATDAAYAADAGYAEESGYSVSSGSVEWTNVQNKPATFPPSAHNHDDRYYTETESDSRFVNATGDSMTGNLTLSGYANPHITLTTTTGGSYSYLELYDGSSYGYVIKNKTSSTTNGVLPGSLYLYTDSGKATQIVHNGTSNAAFLSGGDVYIRGQVYVGGNGASTGTQLVYNSGTWSISISGNANSAINLIGLGSIQSTSVGTSYTVNYQVRENSGGGSNTNEIYAPQLAFHWSGVVASSIMMEASGRIAIRNNPGGSYENFAAAVITATGGNSTQWNTAYGWGNHATAGYLTSETDSQTLAWEPGSKSLSISNGNDITLDGLASEDFVTSQGYITGYTEADTLASVTGRGASTTTDLTFNGTLTMGTGGTQYIRMGRFPASITNTGEAWIGRASDRNTGTMTVQLGGNSASGRSFEVVDYAWSVVLFSVGSNGNLTVSGTITENSSIRYKKDVVDIESTSSKVQLLRPVKYKKIRDESEEIGLIAEDVAELFPEVVKYDDEGRPDGVNYSRLSVILLKAVQELTERVNKLENK